MEQIVYILSVIILLILTILLKKGDKELNFVKSSSITIVCFLCYNTFVCWLFNILIIPITLISLAILNYIISIVLGVIIVKNKQIQKYTIKGTNIVSVTIIGIVTLAMTYLNFGPELNIKYIMTDAAVHYKAAREFYQNDKLLNKTENTESSDQFMTGAYTNTGILFKILAPIIGEVNLYKVFICFDIFCYFMTGLMLYNIIEKLIKDKLSYILSMIFVVIFMLGYPLNSFIYGYVYLQLSIVIIGTIIALFQEIDKKPNKIISATELFILNFGLIFTYCIFVPVIYLAQGLYFLIKQYKMNKKIFSKENLLNIFITLVIPGILGIIYFAIPHLTSSPDGLFLSLEGYIYRNCWSNFILILPIALICFKIKNDDILIYKMLIISLIIIMAILMIAIFGLNFSTYYYFKYNFILWLLLWYGAIYSVNTFSEIKDFKIAIIVYTIIYVAAMFFTTCYKAVPITKETWDNDENITNAFDIYGINKTVINDVTIDYTQEEMQLIQYVYDEIDVHSNKILILGNPRQEYWFDGIFTYRNRKNMESVIPIEHVAQWNDNQEFKYLLVFYRSYAYGQYKDEILEKKILFENESGIIYVNE